MTTLSLTNPIAGTTADANVIASNNAAILTVINGNIDNTNIAAGAGIAIAKLSGYPSDSTKFLRGDATWAVPTSSSINYATTLPGSPTDGQLTILTDNTTTPTYAWMFQYSGAAAKWIYLGGTGAFAEVTTRETTTTLGSYVALATAGPSFTVPRAGDYMVEIGFEGDPAGGGSSALVRMSYDIGGTGAVDADACDNYAVASASSGFQSSERLRRKTLAASTALVAKYKSTAGAGTWGFANRWMRVTPVTVT